MTTAQIKVRLKKRLDALPTRSLHSVNEFLNFLEYHNLDDDTREILSIPGMVNKLAKNLEQSQQGKTVNWRKVRSDIQG